MILFWVTGFFLFTVVFPSVPFWLPTVKRAARMRRPRTLDQMVASLLNNPALEHEWEHSGTELTNKRAGIAFIGARWSNYPIALVNGERIEDPNDYIREAWRKREKRLKRERDAATLIEFVDNFERQYGTK